MEKKSVKNDNILIILGRHSSDMKSLYHAFALAERINAKVFVLFFKEENFTQEQVTPLEKACLEMVHSACEEGISVSFHIASGRFEEELFNIIKMEHINLVVISNGDTEMELIIKEFKLGIPIQIIKVKGKNNINPI